MLGILEPGRGVERQDASAASISTTVK